MKIKDNINAFFKIDNAYQTDTTCQTLFRHLNPLGQIEAGRRAMTRNARRGGKIWVRIFPDKPVTVKPAETRMGSVKALPNIG
ncbi:hypothetical protein R6Q59_005691 [Mikania micrantha]